MKGFPRQSLRIPAALLTVGCVLSLGAAESRPSGGYQFGKLGNIHTSTSRMPFYKDNRLEFYVVSRKVSFQGSLVLAEYPVIDVVRKGSSVEEVARQSQNEFRCYALNSPLADVLKFWADRLCSEAVLASENAQIDQLNQVASGKDKVHVRSPLLDLDGVGFSADFSTKLITVNSQVEVVLRNKGGSLGDGLDMIGGMEKKKPSNPDAEPDAGEASGKISVIQVFGDRLTLDLKRNLVILQGRVRVLAPEGKVFADRLELEFQAQKSEKSAVRDKTADAGDFGTTLEGTKLSRARFIGKVRAVRNLPPEDAGGPEQYATAERAVYEVARDTLTLTGKRPTLGRGKDFAQADRIEIQPRLRVVRLLRHCFLKYTPETADGKTVPPNTVTADFMSWDYPKRKIHAAGWVKMKVPSEQTTMRADRADILLGEADGASESRVFRSSSGLRPETVTAVGHVAVDRTTPDGMEKMRTGKLTYTAKRDRVLLEDRPSLSRGPDRAEGGVMEYFLKEEQLRIGDGSWLYLFTGSLNRGGTDGTGQAKAASAPVGTASGDGSVEITSQSSDLRIGGNRLDFMGEVRLLASDGTRMQCDTLGIDLVDGKAAPGAPAASGSAAATAMRKVPHRMFATGNVVAEDGKAQLLAGQMEVRFGDRAVPGKVDVEKILADRAIRIQNIPEIPEEGDDKQTDPVTTLTANRAELDLLTDTGDFYENVKIAQPELEFTCRHLKALAVKTADRIPPLSDFRAAGSFPNRIGVGPGRELRRIIGSENVKITRKLSGGLNQQAVGDQAVYEVKDRTVTLTAEPPKQPQAFDGKSGMAGDKVVIDLDSEELTVENGSALAPTQGLSF